jgi:hypothetical protein
MADPQQGQQPMTETMPGMPQGADPVAMMRAYLQSQQQMAPSMTHTQAQVQPREQQDTRGGPQSKKQASVANFGASLQNIVSKVTQQVQQRKATEQQHVFDRFTQSTQGIQQAQNEMTEAQEALKQNPQDPATLQRVQRAQQAMQQNRTILDAMFNGPHGEKNAKMLSKGFGIDDKNADTPERKAAITAMKKSMGVGDKAAGILSQLPQTSQPTGQPGIKPPTGDAILRMQGQERGQDIKAVTDRLRMANQAGISLDKLKMTGTLKGIEVSRGENGELVTHIMSPEERAKVPYLKAQDDLTAAKTEAQRAMADAKMNPNNPELRVKMMDAQSKAVDAQARMLAAQAAQMRAMTAQAKEPPEVAAARKSADALETEYAKAQQYVKTPSPTNDTALIFSFVRAQVAGAGRMTNTEIEQALKSGSFGTRYSNMYNRATKGELDPDFRSQLADSIKIAADKARLTADKYDTKKQQDGASFDDLQKALEDLAH